METQNLSSNDDTIFNEFENEQVPVTKNIRLLNYVIDIIIFYILSVILGVVLGVLSIHLDKVSLYVLIYAIFFLYYFLFELSSARTIGKLITGSKVVSTNGEKLTSKQIALRSLSRLVPFDSFSFLGSDGGWHDRWADTIVVKVNRVI